mmetsp:Transcript_14569/g.29150  ORF Transcript_14569/g.29150 Transcript_14569/m.29150 type:complete len:202 (+) Transcript_14569:245-850(+)
MPLAPANLAHSSLSSSMKSSSSMNSSQLSVPLRSASPRASSFWISWWPLGDMRQSPPSKSASGHMQLESHMPSPTHSLGHPGAAISSPSASHCSSQYSGGGGLPGMRSTSSPSHSHSDAHAASRHDPGRTKNAHSSCCGSIRPLAVHAYASTYLSTHSLAWGDSQSGSKKFTASSWKPARSTASLQPLSSQQMYVKDPSTA